MVGGGNNAFIGAVHHAAALMDNRIELVCGCFSSHPDISLASGREYFLPDNRIYFSHAEMIEKESALPDGERMDFISIVTPNVTHFEPAMMASQVAVGDENALKIRIYGEKGGIEWRQEEPNTLLVKRTDRPTEIVRVGNGYMGAAAKANTRTPQATPRATSRPSPTSTATSHVPSWPSATAASPKPRGSTSRVWTTASAACSSSRPSSNRDTSRTSNG